MAFAAEAPEDCGKESAYRPGPGLARQGAEEAGQGEFPADDRQFPVFRQDGHSDG